MNCVPNVFAVYRRDSQTFQLLQCERDDDGNITRLRNWARPRLDPMESYTEEELHLVNSWTRGQEWYVESAPSEEERQVYSTIIHDQEYKWWYLNHVLVWSNFMIYDKKEGEAKDLWYTSPSVPVLEFNNKLIYPRANVGFYPRWCDVQPEDFEEECAVAKFYYHQLQNLEEVDPKSLRIKTPPSHQEDSDSENESNDMYTKTLQNRCLSSLSLAFLVTSVMGLYAYIGKIVCGY